MGGGLLFLRPKPVLGRGQRVPLAAHILSSRRTGHLHCKGI